MRENRTFPPPVKPNDWPVINIDWTDEQRRQILAAAKALGMTVADFIRFVLEEELKKWDI